MKTYDDVDVLVSRWLEATAPTREPEHLLGDVLRDVERTGRRPAWRIPERWIPMDTTARFRPVPRVAPLFIALALLLLVAVVAYLVGSRPKLPPPIGPADNGRIAYVSEGQLWLAGSDGSNPRAITSDRLVKGVPHFSRDGTKVAFLAFDSSQAAKAADAHANLIVADADGSHPVTIAEDVMWMRYVDISPDSSRIAYSSFDDSAMTYQHERIAIAPTDGSAKPTRIGDPDLSALYPAFSPDGTRIAFISDHYPDQCGAGDCFGVKSFGLHVMNADGTDVRVLAHGSIQPLMDVGFDRWAPIIDWSPDGTTILFTGVDATTNIPAGLYVVAADGSSPPRRIESGSATTYGASYSPKGDQIAYVRSNGFGWEAVVADADGSHAQLIASDIARFAPRWSPDGHSVAVIEPIQGSTATVRTVPVDGEGHSVKITVKLDQPADDPIGPTNLGIDQISWQRLAP